MEITSEMWVAIIGALAALVGAVFSTFSIILSNKNRKSINLLENSKSVKSDIANKRYNAYNNIIKYINSWYDVKYRYDHDYLECDARRYLRTSIFENRLNNTDKIIEELNVVSSLTLEYFYLDKKTYICLKGLESYLETVISHAYNEKIDNFEMFSYIVYCDIWFYVVEISKYVNKFFRQNNTLRYRVSKKFQSKKVERLFNKTDFNNIYFNYLLPRKFVAELENKKNPLIVSYEKEIIEIKEEIGKCPDKQLKKLLYKKMDIIKRTKIKMSKIKFPKKYTKFKVSNAYKMWQICNNCQNKDCILSNKHHINVK